MEVTEKKRDNRGRKKGFSTHKYTHCVECRKCFKTEIKYSCMGMCAKCYNRIKLVKSNNQKRLSPRELLPLVDCIRWIAKQYDNNFYVDMKGLSDLIYVYDSMGGSQQNLDELKPGVQLQKMWNYCNDKFLNEYKNILDIEI